MLIKLLRPFKKFAGKCIRLAYKLTYRLFKVDDKLAIFISFHGRGNSDKPKAIYEQMRQDPRFDGYRFIWFIKNHKEKGSVQNLNNGSVRSLLLTGYAPIAFPVYSW